MKLCPPEGGVSEDKMKSFGLTDRGKVRKDNQDSFIIEKCTAKDCLIVALCDGMGGAKAGGVASQLSNRAFVAYIYNKLNSGIGRQVNYRRLLGDACTEANGVAYEYSQFSEEFHGMGTTIVGGVIKSNGNGYIINVGDSRAYHVSRRNGSIIQITRDHSLVEELVAAGTITREEALHHPRRNVITRAVGTGTKVDADYFDFFLQSGDALLLCSDGLTNTLSDEEILRCVLELQTPEEICRSLMAAALERGARDNVTVLVVSR